MPPAISPESVRLAVDIGGTFTDVVLETSDARYSTKVLTTKAAPEDGVLDGMLRALKLGKIEPGQVGLIVHGTTLATNAIIERKGAKTALVTTQGFRDSIEMAQENRFEQYDIFIEKPEPLAPRTLRFTVPERTDARGGVRLALDEKAVEALADTLKVKGVAAQTENLLTIQDSGALSALNVGPDRRVGINSAPGSATTLLVRATTATDVGLLVAGAASQSTHLIRATDSALSTKFYVDQSGNVFANGNIDSADFTDWASYTPLWANAGSATFATRTGRWRRIGKKTVAFYIFVEIDNAGSGGTNVTTTLPTVPNRTIRQTFGGHAEGISASINAVCAVGGSTNVVDAMLLNSSSGTGNITGVACTAGRKFTIEGIYEEA